jgi:16S rRNA (uracil1498-N3)-methyltransferase
MAAGKSSAHVLVVDLENPALDDADFHHLGSVVRLRPGEHLSATDGRGGTRTLVWLGGGAVDPDGDVERTAAREPRVTVALSPVKGDRPDWAVQKLTELGVDRIVLMHADRSVVLWGSGRAAGHLVRLRRVARSALMQSRGVWMPEIDVGDFQGFETSARRGDPVAMAVPGAVAAPSLELPTVLVGPEGGWSPQEQASGLPQVGLGPSVLRAETAAVAAGVLLCALRAGLVAPR